MNSTIPFHMPFHQYLNKFIELSKEEFEQYLLPFICIRRFERKEIVTHAGEVENYFNFVLKGLARKYYKSEEGEINTQIAYEEHIIYAHESFHSRTPSEHFIET